MTGTEEAEIKRVGPEPFNAGRVDNIRAFGYGETAAQRTFRDYVLILRERVWYVVVVFLAVFLASLIYTLTATKLYTSSATIEILARDPVVMKVQEVRASDLHGPEDLNTEVKILESSSLVQKVAERLTPAESKTLTMPFEKDSSGEPVVPETVIAKSRKILPARMTRVIQVVFTHPDPEMAARVANLFVEEFINYNVRWRVEESMKAVEDLKIRADQQAQKVQELGNNLQAYRERQNMVSLDEKRDIVTEKLKALSALVTQANSRLMDAQVRWNQVQDCLKNHGDLTNLGFIDQMPMIQTLRQQIDTQKVTIADLQQRFRAKYPSMIAANQSLAQSQSELSRALDDASQNMRNEYETALRDYNQAKADLAAQETEALKLDRFAVDYGTLENELNVNKELLASIMTRMRETSMSASIEFQNARVLDKAVRPSKASSPVMLLNLALGAFGGLGLGLALAFTVAFVDDRVKSAYQVESIVGLPLIGIVPKIRKSNPAARGQVVMNKSDALASEAFLTIHSNLRLKAKSRDSKVMLVTSTRPGEGKSFVASNLALAFAKHGERVIIVDCDLRKPNIHNVLGVANTKGVIDICGLNAPIESVVIKEHVPNLDILTAGGRAVNPTNILNHESFPRLIEELRKRYSRVIIDTPPLAPVSDAMIIVQHVDGVIFTLRFNFVRTRGAQFCVRRLLETNVPCFGAILNGLDLSLSDYYYGEYYDKSYKSYVTQVNAPVVTQT
jgi:capsular exopolysaccharide synthesis family protein